MASERDELRAGRALYEALMTRRDVSDAAGQGSVLVSLGSIRALAGDYQGAAQAMEEALGIFRHVGNRRGHANALLSLGDARRMTGDYAGAAQATEEALSIYRSFDPERPRSFRCVIPFLSYRGSRTAW
jgi:tetratricopeptide (TPR) repeat protein